MTFDFLKKKRHKNRSAELEIIQHTLAQNKIELSIAEVYRLGETVYESDTQLNRIREEIAASNIAYLLGLSGVDITKDLIQIYLVVNNKDENFLLGIIDPYEPFASPTLFGYSENVDYKLETLKERKIK